MTDLTRYNNGSQKKGLSVFAMKIEEGTEANNIAAATGNHLLGVLPPNAIVTDAQIHVMTVSDAATSHAATLGTASGGAQLLTGADLKTAGKQGTFVSGVESGTGAEIWLNNTVTGAITAVGVYLVVVEYLEFTKTNGELTKFAL